MAEDRFPAWEPPRIWEGRVAFVVGGGPSLIGWDPETVRGQCVVGVNNAYSLVPFADFLYFHDPRWAEWHAAGVLGFPGTVVTCGYQNAKFKKKVKFMKRERAVPLTDDRKTLAGLDSGAQAINLAFHLGAPVVVMMGFDMGFRKVNGVPADQTRELRPLALGQRTSRGELVMPRPGEEFLVPHWHPDHAIPSRETNYEKRFLPTYGPRRDELAKRGVLLVSGTPTRIDVPQVPVDVSLSGADNVARWVQEEGRGHEA